MDQPNPIADLLTAYKDLSVCLLATAIIALMTPLGVVELLIRGRYKEVCTFREALEMLSNYAGDSIVLVWETYIEVFLSR